MRWLISACNVLCLIVSAGSAQGQVVTDVKGGDEIVVAGLGKIKLIAIEDTDPGPFSLGGNTAPPARTDPENQAPPTAAGGVVGGGREPPPRDRRRHRVRGQPVRHAKHPPVDDKKKGAYVFVDGVLVNAELVRQGRAKVDRSRNYVHAQELLQAEQQAKESGVGIWTTTSRP